MNLHRSLSFVILIVTYSVTIAQNNPLYPGHELFIHTEGNNPNYSTVKFWMTAVDAVWDQDANIYDLGPQKLIGSLNFARAYHINNPSNDNIPIPNSSNYWGMENVLSFGYGFPYDQNIFGYGLYLAAFGYNYDDPIISFFLDYRDCDYTKNYAGADIWIKFNASNNTVKIDWNNSNFTDYVTTIENNNTYAIWMYMPKTLRQYIQNTNYLELYLRVSNSEGNPRLTWNPTAQSSWTGYKIYRSINTQGGAAGIFSAIATVGKYVNEYTDYDLGVGSPWKVYYKVITENNGNEVGLFSNMVEIGVAGFQKRSDLKEVKTISVKVLELHQNYPNPFNPVTNIKFHLPALSVADRQAGIPKTNHVTLKVYDVLGREVATLVDEVKPAGDYEVQFTINDSRLTSAVYFYQLRSGSYVDTKKMVIIK
ncbi:MAG: T9SS type A sorting domain-containing protein [Bacteroidetes bacterium]|nr:T9SS type A sorting domain-containing protein [Bacteroidota bacterium]